MIDWESTTTRPLWACAHVPAFVQSSPFTARLFREIVARMATSHTPAPPPCTAAPDGNLASLWLHYESAGARLRHAHRCVEWDGWEEGLVSSILGPEEAEEEWFKEGCTCVERSLTEDEHEDGEGMDTEAKGCVCGTEKQKENGERTRGKGATVRHPLTVSPTLVRSSATVPDRSSTSPTPLLSTASPITRAKPRGALHQVQVPHHGTSAALRVQRRQAGMIMLRREREQEQMLVSGGDICGGRGGELGRRLEAWLSSGGVERERDDG